MISIIIPVYNHAKCLEKCIISFLNQTYKEIEFVVVNDGSTDCFEDVYNDIKEKISNQIKVTLIKQQNQGASSARNRGFEASTGEFVLFADADTIARPKMLENMLKGLNDSPKCSFAFSKYKFGCKTMKSSVFDVKKLQMINYIDTTSLIRRQDFVGFDKNLKRFQDWDMFLTMTEQGKTGIFINEILYKKIVRGRVGISSWTPSFIYNLLAKTKKIQQYKKSKEIVLKKHGLI
ncbi:MAG: glycosyltransferase family A protein [bacterium]